jgi:hypothetical protein
MAQVAGEWRRYFFLYLGTISFAAKKVLKSPDLARREDHTSLFVRRFRRGICIAKIAIDNHSGQVTCGVLADSPKKMSRLNLKRTKP